MLTVDYAQWNQTPEDLRIFSLKADHARTRERFLALYEITQGSYPTKIANHTNRHFQTVMKWVHQYNAHGPEAMKYRLTGGHPLFVKRSKIK